MRFLIWLSVVVAIGYTALCGLLFAFQRSLLYHPLPCALDDPATVLKLSVPDAVLAVSYRPHAGPKAVIYFGGNGEDVSLDLAPWSSALSDRALYLLQYRGYGGSSGSPSEAALHADAEALFDRVREEHTDIAVIGRSLGSGVAVRLASRRPVARLVLVTPYDSIAEIAARLYPRFPVRWLLRDKFESFRYAPQIRVPTLLLTAANDEIIPTDSTARLLAAFPPGIASLEVFGDADHNTISTHADYFAAIRKAL